MRTSCGALNLWEAVWPPDRFGGALIISGLLGETFRTNIPSTSPFNTRALALGAFYNPPSLDLLTDQASADVFMETCRLLLAPLDEGAAAEDLHDAYYIQHRIRRWTSVRPGAFATTFFPLLCPRAVQLAFALGGRARVQHVLHDAIIARAGHGLGEVPYVGAKAIRRPWPADFRYPEQGPALVGRAEMVAAFRDWQRRRRPWDFARTGSPASDPTMLQRLQESQRAYREIVHAAPANPAFEIVDRERLLGAIGWLPSLPFHLAKNVHGAMATVIWLGRLEEDPAGSLSGWLARPTPSGVAS